jgi:RNA-binding protein
MQSGLEHTMSLDSRDKKRLRSIGHKLKPVVTIAGKGFTDAVRLEINRALEDHELIKVSIKAEERKQRSAISDEVCASCDAELVQSIGNIVLLYRAAEKPNPKLSNLLR